jgi:hypothetical protein
MQHMSELRPQSDAISDPSRSAPANASGDRLPVKIVLVYDGFTGLIRAWEFWSELMGRLKDEIQFVCSACQCKVLGQLNSQQLETLQHADTHVIVLPSDEQSKLPEELGNWLRIWMPWKGKGGRSVAMLGQRQPNSTNAILLRECLRQIAEQIGLEFLCNADSGQSRRGEILPA